MRGDDPGLAYFEWSVDKPTPVDVDDETAADEAGWAAANPGLGIRISLEHVRKEHRSMDPRTFAVERLCVGDWPRPDDTSSVIDVERWRSLTDLGSGIVGPVCFAFDVTPDRSSGSIAACGTRPDGLPHLEIVEHRRGTGWMVGRMVELAARHDLFGVVCDGKGPAGSLISELEKQGLEVTPVSASEHAQACGLLFDAVDQKGLRHLGTPELATAVRGAATRPLGDAWAWSRKSSTVDISPLVAGTLAFWGCATELGKQTKEPPRVIDLASV